MNIIMYCWWQILLATAAYFVLGAIWFNKNVFGTLWAKSHGIAMDSAKSKEVNMPMMMGFGFVCTIFICWSICYLTCNQIVCTTEGCSMSLMHCIKIGVMVGGVCSAAIAMSYAYQMKSINAYITDCGYHMVGCVLAAVIMHYVCM